MMVQGARESPKDIFPLPAWSLPGAELHFNLCILSKAYQALCWYYRRYSETISRLVESSGALGPDGPKWRSWFCHFLTV